MTIWRFLNPKNLRILCLLLALPVSNLSAADATSSPTNATNALQSQDSAAASNESLRAYLQLQEQVQATELAIERNRQEAQTAAEQQAMTLSNQLQAIEHSLIDQRGDELADARRTNHLLLMIVGLFAAIGFGAAMFTAYFQWRALSRLAEISATLPAVRGLPGIPTAPALGLGETDLFGNGAAAQSNTRLLSLIETLEKRIGQLEHTGATPLKALPTGNGHGEAHADTGQPTALKSEDNTAEITPLLEQAQSLLNSDRLEEAIICFDRILTLAPDHAETLVKKGAALEKLRQPQQALECYDRAINADGSMTIAYLHKGGLCNRLERYSEAMECYERALHTQEKKRAA